MNRQEASEQVRQLVAEISQWPLNMVTEDSLFEDGLDCDSLDMVEIITATEREFDIDIDDEQFDSCTTVGQLVDLVAAKVTR